MERSHLDRGDEQVGSQEVHQSVNREEGQHFDVIVVGAGLSGIGAACYLKERCPEKRFTLLEAREHVGGTWDLFRYPGVRSDSDMQTLGFSFRPWTSDQSLAGGPAILDYIKETAEANDIYEHIKYRQKVTSAAWDSQGAQWRLEVMQGDERVHYTCNFLYMCSGYYDYDEGHTPQWPDMDAFGGVTVHPQKWPESLELDNKKIVVIGSGATAVTLVPELAKKAQHVTMLQRSPTYIVSRPRQDELAKRFHRTLSPTLAHRLTRWKNLLYSMFVFNMARWRPEKVKDSILELTRQELGPDFDVDTHFTPRYNPWDQRLCLVPDGDFFESLRAGQASVVTDEIERFTKTGLQLASGETLDADIIITATGLKLKILGGMQLMVDGEPVLLSETFSYKGAMYGGVPNLASALGYTNASWTLKCELISKYVCRLLNHMDANGYASVTPLMPDAMPERPAIDLSSGYIQRGLHLLPKQGNKKPWQIHQNYFQDLSAFEFGSLEDGTLEFKRRAVPNVDERREVALGRS